MMFQSPYGGIGASDDCSGGHPEWHIKGVQSPHGGIGRSDCKENDTQDYRLDPVSITLRWHRCIRLEEAKIKIESIQFQSPYGGIGASDRCS